MTFAVCANLALRSACVYAAVTIYHEVIADAVEASLAMPAVDVLDGEVLALCSGTAMNDDLCNFFVPFILFFNLLSEIRNKAKGQTLRFIFVTDDRLTLVYITFMK